MRYLLRTVFLRTFKGGLLASFFLKRGIFRNFLTWQYRCLCHLVSPWHALSSEKVWISALRGLLSQAWGQQSAGFYTWNSCILSCSPTLFLGLPAVASGKESDCNSGVLQELWVSLPGSGRLSGENWQPTPVFFVEKSHGERSLAVHRAVWEGQTDPVHTHAPYCQYVIISNLFYSEILLY